MAAGKQQKLEEMLASTTSVNIDRISSLPDSLLCHILSFLPITTSVTTCVLSRRWRHLWEYLQVFDFKDCFFKPRKSPNRFEDFVPCKSPKRFVDFVNRVLIMRRVCDIQKFSLSCDVNDIRDDAATWIRAAVGPHLEELNISVPPPDSIIANGFYLPQSIFTCTSLVSLTLCGGIDYYKLSSVHLPSLKNLEMDIFYSNPLDKVLSGCPVLETLRLKYKLWGTPSKFKSPSLKSLTFEDDNGRETKSLEICTPSLEYLDINLKTLCYWFSFGNLDNMVEAHIDISPETQHVDFVPDLLKALYRAKLLVLKVATIQCLLLAPSLDFPEFSCLLNLQLDMLYFDSKFLIDLLHNCHFLQSLIIHGWKGYPCQRLQYYEPSSWTQPTTVPTCVMSHLEIFKYGGYQHFVDERAFIVYILESGLVLKTMTIHSDSSMDLEKKLDILKGLSEISRASHKCQLEFD